MDLDEIKERCRLRCYNRKGEEISRDEFSRLMAIDSDYRIVKQEEVGDFLVSTVWLGFDHGLRFLNIDAANLNIYRPVIFETMIFPLAEDGVDCSERYQERCSTEEEALIIHELAVRHVKEKLMKGK